MSQFARPSTDATKGNWTDQGAGTTNLFQAIDETVASDADYVQSGLAPSADVYVTKLSAVEDPQSSSGHTVRYRYGKNASGGAQINLTVELRSAYTNESTQGTLIASWSHTDVSDVLATAAQTLAGAEADSITSYGNLYLRFSATQV